MIDDTRDVNGAGALPTVYRGNQFRSRLEARWAIVFDLIGVPWQYEPEGFALPSGNYLPDFWLPTIKNYFEVKGVEPTERESALAFELSKATGHDVMVAWGGLPVNPDEYGWEDHNYNSKWRDIWLNGGQDYDYTWCRCADCGKYGIQFEGRSPRICRHNTSDKHPRTADDPGLVHAYHVAANYRFWNPS